MNWKSLCRLPALSLLSLLALMLLVSLMLVQTVFPFQQTPRMTLVLVGAAAGVAWGWFGSSAAASAWCSAGFCTACSNAGCPATCSAIAVPNAAVLPAVHAALHEPAAE
jgi:hypothetical protein